STDHSHTGPPFESRSCVSARDYHIVFMRAKLSSRHDTQFANVNSSRAAERNAWSTLSQSNRSIVARKRITVSAKGFVGCLPCNQHVVTARGTPGRHPRSKD